MKTIKIVVGTYGYRKNDTSPVNLINSESAPIEVSDNEADRLIKLGIAEEAGKKAADGTATGHLDADYLEKYSIDELKSLAEEMGIKFKSRASKKELIKLISDTEVEYPVDDANDEDADSTNDEDADNEEPPTLDAVDPE